MDKEVEINLIKLADIIVNIAYISCCQLGVEISCNVFDLTSGFKPTVLLLLPVDPNSLIPFFNLSFKLGSGFWIVADPSYRLEDVSDCVVCLSSSLHFFYSEAEIFNLRMILTVLIKQFAVDLAFCTDIKSGFVARNDKEGQV